jgi:Predicted membrane protein (DUF2207)
VSVQVRQSAAVIVETRSSPVIARVVLMLALALAVLPAAAQDNSQSSNGQLHGGQGVDTPPPAATPDQSSTTANFDPSMVERITNFDSDITVARNGTMTVRETIAVYATGEQIVHGIYRDFPTTYGGGHGWVVKVRFDVTGATMDGHDAHYSTSSLDNGVRVKIGDADTIISSGRHVFVLTYMTARQIGSFDTYDELYWNVTGNGWVFPIDKASATIHLPSGAKIQQSAFYTGAQGETGQNAIATRQSDDTIRFSTTQVLAPYEGLTVAASFNKGIIAPPSAAEKARDFIIGNASTVVAMMGVFVLTIFYLIVWWQHGRDPRRGTIVPLFAPPDNLSPEAVRYIHRMAYDRKAFAAALVNMAVKGYLKIRENKGVYTLERTGKGLAECGLSTSETAMGGALFKGRSQTLELVPINFAPVQEAVSALQQTLSTEYEKHYFVTNLGWFMGGTGILALTALATALLSEQGLDSVFQMIWLLGWSILVVFLLHRTYTGWVTAVRGPGSRTTNVLLALFLTIVTAPLTYIYVFSLVDFRASMSDWTSVALTAGGLLSYVFYYLLKAPTALGAVARAKIDGFRMFLETAEKDRLELMNPPTVTPELFEKYLPYAIALDCENRWSARFESEAEKAGVDPHRHYTPLWYVGVGFAVLGTAGLATSIGSSIGGAVASAAVSPGSVSGIRGGGLGSIVGGFSGGGGGGGGGGGW